MSAPVQKIQLKKEKILEEGDDSTSFAWKPGGGNSLAIAMRRGSVVIWDVETQISRIIDGTGYSLIWSQDGTEFASAVTNQISVFNADSGQVTRTLSLAPQYSAYFLDLAFSPTGRILVVAENEETRGYTNPARNARKYSIWVDEQARKELHLIDPSRQIEPSRQVHEFRFSPDTQLLAATIHSIDYSRWWTLIYDLLSGTMIQVLLGPKFSRGMTWSPNGRFLAVFAMNDATIHMWEVGTGQKTTTIYPTGIDDLLLESESIAQLAWSPDSRIIASSFDTSRIRLWEVETGEVVGDIPAYSDIPEDHPALAFSPDGFTLASAHFNVIRLWDMSHLRKAAGIKERDKQLLEEAWGIEVLQKDLWPALLQQTQLGADFPPSVQRWLQDQERTLYAIRMHQEMIESLRGQQQRLLAASSESEIREAMVWQVDRPSSAPYDAFSRRAPASSRTELVAERGTSDPLSLEYEEDDDDERQKIRARPGSNRKARPDTTSWWLLPGLGPEGRNVLVHPQALSYIVEHGYSLPNRETLFFQYA